MIVKFEVPGGAVALNCRHIAKVVYRQQKDGMLEVHVYGNAVTADGDLVKLAHEWMRRDSLEALLDTIDGVATGRRLQK
jgi:hypothetical protein